MNRRCCGTSGAGGGYDQVPFPSPARMPGGPSSNRLPERLYLQTARGNFELEGRNLLDFGGCPDLKSGFQQLLKVVPVASPPQEPDAVPHRRQKMKSAARLPYRDARRCYGRHRCPLCQDKAAGSIVTPSRIVFWVARGFYSVGEKEGRRIPLRVLESRSLKIRFEMLVREFCDQITRHRARVNLNDFAADMHVTR